MNKQTKEYLAEILKTIQNPPNPTIPADPKAAGPSSPLPPPLPSHPCLKDKKNVKQIIEKINEAIFIKSEEIRKLDEQVKALIELSAKHVSIYAEPEEKIEIVQDLSDEEEIIIKKTPAKKAPTPKKSTTPKKPPAKKAPPKKPVPPSPDSDKYVSEDE